MKKRGMSMVVTTLIIILLAIVAIGIVWVVVKNIISKGKEDISLTGLTLDLEILKASVDEDTNILSVTVKRKSGDGTLIGINFIIGDGDNSVVVRRDTNLAELGTETFTFDLDTLAVGEITSIEIAPIYESSSGKETIGEIKDTATYSAGSIGSGSGPSGGTPPPGGVVCGNGILELGEECDDGNSISGDGCSSTCQDEGLGGPYCGDGICGVIETSENCPADCTGIPLSCNGSWSPPEDLRVECDGGYKCLADCTCPAGFTADGSGGCNLSPPINTGAIFSVWPSGAVKYFDSEDLPVDVSAYTSYYANFTDSSENGCFRITWAEYLELNGRSYIRTEFIVDVAPGETYNVWEAENCGQ